MAGTIQSCGRSSRLSKLLEQALSPILCNQTNRATKISRRVMDLRILLRQANRGLQTSRSLCKIFEVPSRTEVECLKKLYPNPKGLIHGLLQPLVHSGVIVMPQVVVMSRLGGRFFRAKLQLHCPRKVTVSAVHDSIAGAEENAYLLACDLLKNMGLLYQPPSGGMMPVSADHILEILHTLHSTSHHPFSPTPPEFSFTTTPTPASNSASFIDNSQGSTKRGRPRSNQLWRTEVTASCPYRFDVSSMGPSAHASKYTALLLTGIKLKALGLLSTTNCLALSRLPSISRRQRATLSIENFDPHYEIYSDASALGFGAYLVPKHNYPIHWLANLWSEHFPDSPRIIKGQQPGPSFFLDSTFCELYAVVTACFTWKHKFVGKRVLVWTDSKGVVDVLNWGVSKERNLKRWGKLLSILEGTCQKYSIEVRACYVHRSKNLAADLLSRCKTSAFREAVPDAAPLQKKTKKLLFLNPLQQASCGPGVQTI